MKFEISCTTLKLNHQALAVIVFDDGVRKSDLQKLDVPMKIVLRHSEKVYNISFACWFHAIPL